MKDTVYATDRITYTRVNGHYEPIKPKAYRHVGMIRVALTLASLAMAIGAGYAAYRALELLA